MKKVLFILLLFIGFILSAENKMVIAVTPFDNTGKDKSLDYIGFQISEYLSTALTSVEGIEVIERSKIDEILKEQNFQLQGLTDSDTTVTIGNLANAKQLIVGSFNKSNSKLSIQARIVNAETSVIIHSASIVGEYSDNITPLFKDLFYRLLGRTPPEEYFSQMSILEQRIAKLESLDISTHKSDDLEKSKIELNEEISTLQATIKEIELQKVGLAKELQELNINLATEAELKLISEKNIKSTIEAAKVKTALFNNSNEDAIKYMESAFSQAGNDITIYSALADQYYETISEVDGESFYVKLLEKQLEHNKVLSEEAEALSIYRNKVKILYDRLEKLITPDMFQLSVGKKEEIELGSVSATVKLPTDITVFVAPGIEKLITQVINEQNFIQLDNGFKYTETPEKLTSLLPNENIMNLFLMSITAEMGYSIQFLDRNEKVIYELNHKPLSSLDLTIGNKALWKSIGSDSYEITKNSNGIQYINGVVEIQARKLKDLDHIKVVLNRETFNKNTNLVTSSDNLWESILLDGYRQKYIKLFSNDSTMPQVKDIVITHSVISIRDYLTDIPLLIDHKSLPANVDLSAIAYWGDKSSAVVTGEWNGSEKFTSPIISGDFDENSKLIFSIPAIMNKEEKLEFKISADNESQIVD